MKKYFILVFLFYSLSISKVHAADEFKTEYKVTYDIQDNSETFVTQEIKITNLKGDVIASNYTLSVRHMDIYEVNASDTRGEMDISEEVVDGATRIKAKFNENIIGKGRINDFQFKYSFIHLNRVLRIEQCIKFKAFNSFKLRLYESNKCCIFSVCHCVLSTPK